MAAIPTKTKVNIKKSPEKTIPTVTIKVTRDSLFPDLPVSIEDREDFFIDNYGSSHHSGSYNLPPNRAQFEFLWANCVSGDREIVLRFPARDPHFVSDLAHEVLPPMIKEINLKREFCKYPSDPDLADKMGYIIFMMGYNMACQIATERCLEYGSQCLYKKVDFIVPQNNHHAMSRDNSSSQYLGSEWRYRNCWCLFFGCHRWNDILKSIEEDDWETFWGYVEYTFRRRHSRLVGSDIRAIVSGERHMTVPNSKKRYIKDEYLGRGDDGDSVISKLQLIRMIENCELPSHVLGSIQRIVETCQDLQ